MGIDGIVYFVSRPSVSRLSVPSMLLSKVAEHGMAMRMLRLELAGSSAEGGR